MSNLASRIGSDESRVYDTRYPPYSRSNSSSQVSNCYAMDEVSQPWQGSNDPGESAINGGHCLPPHLTSDVIRGHKLNLLDNECSGTLDGTHDPVKDRVHCVKKVRLSQEAETPKFDGQSTSFTDFVEEFLRCAKYNCWDETDTLFHLWNSIVGHAKIIVKTMPYPNNLDTFLKELTTVFYSERRVEAYRDQLANVERAQNMDLETYGYYLLDLARKAYPLARSLEQERNAKEAFFKTAGSNNLYVWLKAYNPKTLKASIDIACQFEEAMKVSHGMSQKKPDESVAGQATAVGSDSVNFVQTLDGQVKCLAAELKGVQDLLRSGSSGPVKASSAHCCDCGQPKQLVNQLQSLTREVRTFGERLQCLAIQVGTEPSCSVEPDVAHQGHSTDLQKSYVCNICNKGFKAKRSLKAHCETSHEPRFQGYECPKNGCLRTFHPLHKGLMKSHLTMGHGCAVGEVKEIIQGVKLTLVANPNAQDTKVAGKAPGVIRDPQASALWVKDRVRRSRRRGRRKQSSKPKMPSPQHLPVSAVTKASIGLKVPEKAKSITGCSSEIHRDQTSCLGPTCGDLINLWDDWPSEVDPPDSVRSSVDIS